MVDQDRTISQALEKAGGWGGGGGVGGARRRECIRLGCVAVSSPVAVSSLGEREKERERERERERCKIPNTTQRPTTAPQACAPATTAGA